MLSGPAAYPLAMPCTTARKRRDAVGRQRNARPPTGGAWLQEEASKEGSRTFFYANGICLHDVTLKHPARGRARAA